MSCGDGITCQEAVTVVQEFLDGALDGVSSAQVRTHFEICSRCYPHLRFERAFRDALARATRGESAPPELRERVVELLAGAAAEGGGGSAQAGEE